MDKLYHKTKKTGRVLLKKDYNFVKLLLAPDKIMNRLHRKIRAKMQKDADTDKNGRKGRPE